jgi:hypothetical protein
MDELSHEGSRALLFDGTSGFVSLGNDEVLQIEGVITMEACIRIEGDIRPGQRSVIHRNIIAHGHDRITEVKKFVAFTVASLVSCGKFVHEVLFLTYARQVFLRINLYESTYEAGSWIGASIF